MYYAFNAKQAVWASKRYRRYKRAKGRTRSNMLAFSWQGVMLYYRNLLRTGQQHPDQPHTVSENPHAST